MKGNDTILSFQIRPNAQFRGHFCRPHIVCIVFLEDNLSCKLGEQNLVGFSEPGDLAKTSPQVFRIKNWNKKSFTSEFHLPTPNPIFAHNLTIKYLLTKSYGKKQKNSRINSVPHSGVWKKPYLTPDHFLAFLKIFPTFIIKKTVFSTFPKNNGADFLVETWFRIFKLKSTKVFDKK